MTARATDADLNVLMDTSGKTYTLAISTANLLVNEELVGAGLSDERLTAIEQYLAAHFATLAIERGGLLKETIGLSSETYKGVGEKLQGFTSTRFGQQAIALDSTGTLSSLGSGGLKAEFRVV